MNQKIVKVYRHDPAKYKLTREQRLARRELEKVDPVNNPFRSKPMKLYKCENGRTVGTSYDAHPDRCKAEYVAGKNVNLYESNDGGETWKNVGYFEWLTRFGELATYPTYTTGEQE